MENSFEKCDKTYKKSLEKCERRIKMIFSKPEKDYLYDYIKEFFAEGGTLDDFFDVLHYFMEDFDLVERKD